MICRAQTLVRVMPSSSNGFHCAFFQEFVPLLMPLINGICKRLLIRIAQNMHNLSQLFARFKFRSPREVACNNSFLMKVTHLHRQLGEKFSYPWSAIYYYGLKRKALPLKCISCALVLVDCLALNFAPIHIAAVVSITHNKITT